MGNSSRKYRLLFIVLNFFLIQQLSAQYKNNVWSFGLGGVAADYYPTNEANSGGLFNEFFNIEDHWNFGVKLNASRILSKKFFL